MKPQRTIVLAFLLAISVGTFLLSLPVSAPPGRPLSFLEAAFTACSAVCVTGLTVIDPGVALSNFGRIVLMVLVELGGLGVMSMGTFILVVVGRRLSMANEFSVMNAYGTEQVKGLRGLVVWAVGIMLTCEFAGAVVMWHVFTRGAESLGAALCDDGAWFRAAYHAVMGFCNAGFALSDDSLIPFRGDPLMECAMGGLCFVGGIGFLVIINLFTIKFWRRNRRTRGRLTLHSKVVLATTFLIIAGGSFLFVAFEWNSTLANMSPWEKIEAGIAQTVISHTAGFTMLPTENIRPVTRLLNEALMMVGGSPGSSAGGIKTTTIAVLVFTVYAMCRGRDDTTIFERTVPRSVVRESIVIFVFACIGVVVVLGSLLVTESGNAAVDHGKLLFEAVSALTTTGLSLGVTPHLTVAGKLVLMATMFIGRLGALTVVLVIGNRDDRIHIRYPNEELVVG